VESIFSQVFWKICVCKTSS